MHRRPTYERLIREGVLPAGIAADDGVGLLYEDEVLTEVVTSRCDTYAFRVAQDGEELLTETLTPRLLPKGTWVQDAWPPV